MIQKLCKKEKEKEKEKKRKERLEAQKWITVDNFYIITILTFVRC